MASGDIVMTSAPIAFTFGLGATLMFPLRFGAACLTIEQPSPPAMLEVIAKFGVTHLATAPTAYKAMLSQPALDEALKTLKCCLSAGEHLPKAVWEAWKERTGIAIVDGIGSTEALHMFISNRPGAIRTGSSGQIVSGYEAAILDSSRQPVPTGEIGNLWISGDSVCVGYWNKHQQTQDTIEGRWLRTGDKYTQDADGYFWYAGRSDDMLKVGGQWVSPVEVENALLQHPDVQECGVIGREDHDNLIKPMAFVVLRSGIDPNETRGAELEQFVRTKLADFKRPRWVVFLPELPKTATGKIQRFRLRELATTGK